MLSTGVYRRRRHVGLRDRLPVALRPVGGTSATVDADDAAIAYIPAQYTDSAGQRQLDCRNSEVWFSMYGDSLTCEYRAAGTAPLWISVDGGAWALITGAFVNTGAGTATSGEMLPGGTSDGAHDIRLRLTNGYTGGFYFVISGALTASSTGGTASISAHTNYGEHQAMRGSHGLTYWEDSFSDDNTSLGGGYSSPIFPAAAPSTATVSHREAYVKFNVDTNTTTVWPTIEMDTNAAWRLSVWVDGKMISKTTQDDGISANLGTLLTGISIPGSGTREVTICNLKSCYGITTDGAFVTTAVTQPTQYVVVMGDSTSSGDSHTQDRHAVTPYMQNQMFRDDFRFYNCALSGDTVVACTTANRIDNDVAALSETPTHIIFNYGVNDASRWNSDAATVQAEYETELNDLLTTFGSAKVYVVPPSGDLSGFITDVRNGISAAVTAVGSSRCVYVDSSNYNCDAGVREGAHPSTLGYGQLSAFGVVELTDQPSDADTITIDGTVYEFESTGGVTGGNVSVTIGSDVEATTRNLAAAIEGQGGTVLIENVDLSGTADEGLVLPSIASISKSGTNIAVYLESEGWRDLFDTMLTTRTGVGLLLLGVG